MLGILFAIGALLGWGLGDFLIQRTTRKIGDWKTLFFIGITALVVIFPLIAHELPALWMHPQNIAVLVLGSLVMFFGALFDFEALKRGKIAIVEPLLGIEVPVAVGLSITIWHEHISLIQALLIFSIFIGVTLAITLHHTHLHYHKRVFERGVMLAGLAAVGMGLMNFLVGVSSQEVSPLLAIWFIHGSLAVFCFVYLLANGNLKSIVRDFKQYPAVITAQSVIDNAAWVFYAYSTTLIPISIATTISESYIALAVFLGIFFNKEKLRWHQLVGVAIACIGIILLSRISR